MISGTTDYPRFQAAAMKQRYSIRFPVFDQSSPRGDLYRFCREEGAIRLARIGREAVLVASSTGSANPLSPSPEEAVRPTLPARP